VRQEDGVDRIAHDGQLRRPAYYVGAAREPGRRHYCLMARSAAGEQLPCPAPGANLEELPAENILQSLAEKLRFGGQQGAAKRLAPPGAERRVSVQDA